MAAALVMGNRNHLVVSRCSMVDRSGGVMDRNLVDDSSLVVDWSCMMDGSCMMSGDCVMRYCFMVDWDGSVVRRFMMNSSNSVSMCLFKGRKMGLLMMYDWCMMNWRSVMLSMLLS